MSAQPLEAIEIETAPNPTACIIWMHGLGADGGDFAPLAGEIAMPVATRYIFPHAPMMPVTINGGYVMRAWYDISDAAIRREDESGVRASQGLIENLLAREKSRGVRAENIVLAGFSQGGAMALHAGLRFPDRLAGLVALSCYLALDRTLEAERAAANRGTPIFMAHGTADPVVPFEFGDSSRRFLQGEDHPVEWHTYPIAHGVAPEEIDDIRVFLERVLP